MSDEQPYAGPGSPGAADEGSGRLSDDELRAAYEEELSRITSADMMLQAAVSLLNIGGRRLGLAPPPAAAGDPPAPGPGAAGERDLTQVRDAIDGVRALLGILERSLSGELGPLRDALSQLQMAYAREVSAGAGERTGAPEAPGGTQSEPAQSAPAKPEPDREDPGNRPGPAEASGRLWVPGR